MSSLVRKMEKQKMRVPKKCCGKARKLEEIKLDRVDAEGKPYKIIKHAYVCHRCGRALMVD